MFLKLNMESSTNTVQYYGISRVHAVRETHDLSDIHTVQLLFNMESSRDTHKKILHELLFDKIRDINFR